MNKTKLGKHIDPTKDLDWFCKIICEIENGLIIDRFRYKKFNYWPLIRWQLNYLRKNSKDSLHFDSFNSPIFFIIKIFIFYVYRLIGILKRKILICFFNKKRYENNTETNVFENFLKSLDNIPQAEVLIFSLDKEHHSKIGKLSFAPILDSIFLTIEKRCSVVKVSFPTKSKNKYFVEPYIVDFNPFIKIEKDRLLKPAKLDDLIDSIKIVIKTHMVNKKLIKNNEEIKCSYVELLKRISIINTQVKCFTHVLSSVKPKAVFLTSYTGRCFVPASSNLMQIPCIDVQHGGMHRYNIAATHWSNVPFIGYEMLPKWFLCWNKFSADAINLTSNGPHKALVGGNRYLALCKQPDSIVNRLITAQQRRFLRSLKNKKTILIALQYGKDELLPSHVLDLVKNTTKKWNWLFRLHPVGLFEKESLFNSLNGCIKEEFINLPTQIPLATLLPYCNFLLTKSSTIVYEALTFNVQPIFWSEKGRIHSDLIDNNLTEIALDSKVLSRALEKNFQSLSNHDMIVDWKDETFWKAYSMIINQQT